MSVSVVPTLFCLGGFQKKVTNYLIFGMFARTKENNDDIN